MIESLHIVNYALIDNLDISLDSGLTIITGETGAGKSIILEALSLVMGERADYSSMRDKSRKTVVEAVFSLSPDEARRISPFLENEAEVDVFPNQVILRRELSPRGSSRSFINDTPVNLGIMGTVSEMLLDIHSQQLNIQLSTEGFQREVLDSYAGNDNLRQVYKSKYEIYRDALKQYKDTSDMIKRMSAEAAYLGYQLEQLEELNPQPGEQAQLEKQQELLTNAAEIKENLGYVLSRFDGENGEKSISQKLKEANLALSRLGNIYTESDDLVSRLDTVRLEIEDIVETVRQFDNSLTASPEELAAIEDRLSGIYSLEAKHNVDSIEALISLRDKLRHQLEVTSNADDTLANLEAKARKAKKDAVLAGRNLTESREAAAEKLEALIVRTARPLGMHNLDCRIEITPSKLGAEGADNIEFLFSFNKNQQLTTVEKSASGGEISRIMLALKTILAEDASLSTVIFDEIDTGVSGEVALSMARAMKQLSGNTQVIAITHLPQVAAFGDHHLKVYKQDNQETTLTSVKMLDKAEREHELAAMLSGQSGEETAVAAARQLMESAHKQQFKTI